MTLPASRKLLWPLLLFSALAVAACWPLLTNLHNLGFHDDWDQHFLYLAVPIDTVSRYFEWPSWNPYEFGGNPLFGHPENRFLSPFTPLYFALGPVIAVKLEFAGHLLIAMLGTFALARHFKLTRPSSILAASVFALGQSHLVQFREGHAWFMAFAYLPLAVLFFLRSLASPRNIPMVAAALALMVFEGGIYSAPLTLLALGFLLALASAAARRSWAPLGAFATATVLFALLAAVRLLPIAEALSVNARAVDALEHLSFFELLQCLTLRTGELQDLRWEAHEYQYYVGTVPLLLALMPWLLAPRNGLRLWPLAALGLFGAIFALGNFAPWSPYAALHLLPVFRSLHVTPRFLVFTTLSIGVLAGAGLDAMVLHVGKRRARRWVGPATLAMVALCTLDLLLTGNRALQTAFPRAPKGVARDNAFSQQAWHGDASSALRWLPMYEFFLQNHGMSRAYGDALYGSGHVKPMGSPEYRGEAYVTSAEGHATIESWSPNRVVVATDGPHEAMLVLNQNFGPGWQAEGRALESHRGLVATRVANGPQRVTFFFRPSLLWLGFALSGFGLLFSLALVPRTPPSRSPASSRPKRPFMAINRAKNITR